MLSRLLEGARTTIFGAAFVALVAVVVGTTLAIATAWFGGKFDAGVSAGLDVLFAFPGILLAVRRGGRVRPEPATRPASPWRSRTRRTSPACCAAPP